MKEVTVCTVTDQTEVTVCTVTEETEVLDS
jgi:hypothetical protein